MNDTVDAYVFSRSRAIAKALIDSGEVPNLHHCYEQQCEARAAGDDELLALWSRLRWRALCDAYPWARREGCVIFRIPRNGSAPHVVR